MIPDPPLPAAEFVQRRQLVFDAIGPGAVALLQGAAAPDGFDVFRQTNEFFYLSGIEVPHAWLLLDGRAGRTVVFLPRRDERAERSEGPLLSADTPDAVAALSGADEVLPLDELTGRLGSPGTVYLPYAPAEGFRACRDTLRHAAQLRHADPWDARPSREELLRQRLAALLPTAELRDLSPLLDELRLVKSPAELALLRQAGQLCAHAVVAAIGVTRPGVREYQLAALADYLYQLHGARGGGYRAIVAGGGNAWLAHYYRNADPLRAGDLVLMDYAPEVHYYTSDIGRMWPVDGRYRPWQRELYGFVVEYHRALLGLLRPGVLPEQVLAEAAEAMRPRIAGSFSQPHHAAAAGRMLEFAGHLSHPVGMAVHDPGAYFGRPLRPGTVLAVDPQMWVPEEQLYIRVEDTVAITDDGVEVLTRAAPLDLDALESSVGTAPLPLAP